MIHIIDSPPENTSRSESQTSSGIDIRSGRAAATAFHSSTHTDDEAATDDACCCGCGCSCSRCFCYGAAPTVDANRAIYSGQGTVAFDEEPSIDVNVNALAANFSSLYTSNSLDSISSEQRAPNPAPIITTLSQEALRNRLEEQDSTAKDVKMERYLEDIDDEPWSYFLESSITSDGGMADASGLPFGDMDLDGSMHNNISSGERSMLSSFMSSLQAPRVAASNIVRGAGAGFGRQGGQRNSFLKLT